MHGMTFAGGTGTPLQSIAQGITKLHALPFKNCARPVLNCSYGDQLRQDECAAELLRSEARTA